MKKDNEYTDIYKTEAYDKVKKKAEPTKPGAGVQVCYEWLQALITAIVIVSLLLTFCFRMVDVDGPSMLNTLHDDDRVILTNFMYTPKSGDIVVISHGNNYQKPIIKRVIATEGQTLKIDYDKAQVIVDGVVLDEPYIKDPTTQVGDNEIPEVIPDGKVFVMGDNRENSLDSRYFGAVKKDQILGNVNYITFPFNRFGTIK